MWLPVMYNQTKSGIWRNSHWQKGKRRDSASEICAGAAFITQKDFAERIGVAPSQLSRIESGETKTISSDILIAIATEFDVSADYLLGLSTLQTLRNVDVTMTGLSEAAFNRMVNGEMDMDVLNRLIEHKHFPQLTPKMIRIYFADELEYGIQSRNMMLDVLSDTIHGISNDQRRS